MLILQIIGRAVMTREPIKLCDSRCVPEIRAFGRDVKTRSSIFRDVFFYQEVGKGEKGAVGRNLSSAQNVDKNSTLRTSC